ncbi:MFS transporter-like protein [Aureobasidium sp. EXF-3400]|nr:MFS transporter-like protein [Aureobasidium sp. EXF-12344]KAI4774562.1 MFS transporter-like protein [Aureobasidium sp. EXF-3400]
MAPFSWQKIKTTLQISHDYSVTPAGIRWRSNTFFIVSTVAVGLFTDLFLYGLVVPILPYMLQDRVGLPQDQIQSHVDGLLAAYAGASVIFSPIAGILADKTTTRQGPFLLGLTALLLATVLLFMGNNIPTLVVARLLQGCSAAFVWTIGLALCVETVGKDNLGKTIGSIFSFISVGNLVAPLLGGVLYKKAGYAGVFGIGFAVLTIDFIMRLLVIEKKVARRYNIISQEDSNESDASHPNDEEAANDEEQPLLGSKAEDDYYVISKDQPAIVRKVPILPCLKNPRLIAALVVAFVQALLLGAFDATIPTIGQEYFDFDSLKAGTLFLPLGVFDFLLGPVFGWVVDKYGTKVAAVGGYTFLVPCLVLLRLPHAGALLALCGVGLAAIGAPSIVEAGNIVQKYYDVNPDFFGENGPFASLYAMSSVAFCAGLAIGPEIAGELKQVIGFGNMNIVLAVICGLTAALSFFYIGGKPKMLRGGQS